MDSLALPSQVSLRKGLESQTTAQLKAELSRLLSLTAENLLRLAIIVDVLEGRGEDLSSLRGGFLMILRKIACGELLPDLVVLFADSPAKIQQAARLPVAEQQEIAAGRATLPVKIQARPALAPPPKSEEDLEEEREATAELEEKIKGRYKTMPGRSGETFAPRPDSAAQARSGSPKDVGETAAEMVIACADRRSAVAALVAKLSEAGVKLTLGEPVVVLHRDPARAHPPGYWLDRTKYEMPSEG